MTRAPARIAALGCALACLAHAAAAIAATAVIYQPQPGDRSVGAAQWNVMLAALKARGVDAVVLQWTRNGAAFADQAGRDWLAARALQVRAAGLGLVVGLDADPAFFTRQEMTPKRLRPYLDARVQADASLASQWRELLGDGAIAGWYLPAEVDDRRWREPEARALLVEYFGKEARALAGKPVHASAFTTGNMTPRNFAALMRELQATGVRVWVQDGAGTGRLDAAERERYLAELSACDGTHAQGWVREVFLQTAHDAAFAAVPMPPAAIDAARAARSPCAGDNVLFELRYLPEGAPLRAGAAAGDR